MANKTKTAVRRSSSKKSSTTVAEIAAQAAAGAVKASNRSILKVIKQQSELLATIAASQEEIDARITALESSDAEIDAGAVSSEEEIEVDAARRQAATSSSSASTSSSSAEEEHDMENAADNASSSEDEMESVGDTNTGDLEQHESASSDAEPGHANEGAKNRGKDGAEDEIKKVGKTVQSAREKALRVALQKANNKIVARDATIKTLNKRVTKVEAQVATATRNLSRRSLPPEITSLLAKGNIDAADLLRTGTKMSVAEIDSLLASSGVNLNVQDRTAIKNVFYREGLMEEGRVNRGR